MCSNASVIAYHLITIEHTPHHAPSDPQMGSCEGSKKEVDGRIGTGRKWRGGVEYVPR
jgi:hypothetical protein